MEAELIDDVDSLERYRPAWDELAVELSQPYCAPAWTLAWWHHAAPPSTRLRVIVIRDGEDLVGIAPFYADRWGAGLQRYSLLAAESCWRLEPLARAADRERVARLIAEGLAEMRPAPDLLRFHHLPAHSPWPELIARHWPSRLKPRLVHDSSLPSPVVALESGDLDGWLATKSRNLRQQIRKKRRTLAKEGAVISSSTSPGELERDIRSFFSLHYDRWAARGGSWVTGRQLEHAVIAAAHELVPDGRFRLASVRVDGEMIGAAVVVAAGEEAGYWLGGFDERWNERSPGLVALVEAIDDGLQRPEKRLDLGPGEEKYKSRLADGGDRLHTLYVLPVGLRFPFVRLQLVARSLLQWLRQREAPGVLQGFIGRSTWL